MMQVQPMQTRVMTDKPTNQRAVPSVSVTYARNGASD